jgi:hypothetical protein
MTSNLLGLASPVSPRFSGMLVSAIKPVDILEREERPFSAMLP